MTPVAFVDDGIHPGMVLQEEAFSADISQEPQTPLPQPAERPPQPELPDTLAGLLEVALVDLAAVEKDSRYRVNMYTWHTPSVNQGCHVCLAGAVMAKTLQFSSTEDAVPLVVSSIGRKLLALDALRQGKTLNAADILKVRTEVRPRWIPAYETLRTGWWHAMKQLLYELQAEEAEQRRRKFCGDDFPRPRVRQSAGRE